MWLGTGFRRDVLPSLSNLVLGYLTGVIAGVGVGLLLGQIELLRLIIQPLVSFALTVPPVALLPLFLIALGIGDTMQRSVIAAAVFFVMVVNTVTGVLDTDPLLQDMSRSYGIRGARRVVQVVVPAAATSILAGARVGVSVALLVMVVGEMMGAANGIGAKTLLAQQGFGYDQMWAGVVLLAVLGVALNLLFVLLERRLLRRLGSAEESQSLSQGGR
jgi:ABC-type nitrate/sulfonate/bicarbonate transport system permease component